MNEELRAAIDSISEDYDLGVGDVATIFSDLLRALVDAGTITDEQAEKLRQPVLAAAGIG